MWKYLESQYSSLILFSAYKLSQLSIMFICYIDQGETTSSLSPWQIWGFMGKPEGQCTGEQIRRDDRRRFRETFTYHLPLRWQHSLFNVFFLHVERGRNDWIVFRYQIVSLIKAVACILSYHKGTEHHLLFLRIKSCPGVKVVSCISLKRWLKVLLVLKMWLFGGLVGDVCVGK